MKPSSNPSIFPLLSPPLAPVSALPSLLSDPKGQLNPDTAPHLPFLPFFPTHTLPHPPLPPPPTGKNRTKGQGRRRRRPPPPPPPCRSRPDLRRWGTGVPGSTPPPRVSLASFLASFFPAPPSLLEGSCGGFFLSWLAPRTSGVRLGFLSWRGEDSWGLGRGQETPLRRP